MKKQIVKVQISIFAFEKGKNGKRQVLVYNKDRSIFWEGDCTEEILKATDGCPKKFFYATAKKGGWIELFEEAPTQKW